mgnify:CR=1 FL=1
MESLTVREAAELMGVSPNKLLRYIQKGSIPARKKGWIWLIDPDDLDQARNLLYGQPKRKQG